VTFAEALPIVKDIMAGTSEDEQLRLLSFFCAEKAEMVEDVRRLSKRNGDRGPAFDPKQKVTMAVAGRR
jgi:hypothetical protein